MPTDTDLAEPSRSLAPTARGDRDTILTKGLGGRYTVRRRVTDIETWDEGLPRRGFATIPGEGKVRVYEVAPGRWTVQPPTE